MKRLRLRDDHGVKMEDSSEWSAQQNVQPYVPSPQAHRSANGKAQGGANGASILPWAQHPAQAVSQNGDMRSHRWRIALYSHDAVGLGHRRRNLLIAQTLAYSPLQPVTLMITEVGEASTSVKPPGVDWLVLPALRKDLDEIGRAHV